MRDATFFRLPAILAHTQSLWEGTELQRMQTLVNSSIATDEQLPGRSLQQWNSRTPKRHLGRGKVKLMTAAAFLDMHAGAADSSGSSGVPGCKVKSSGANPGGWLGSMSEGDEAWPAGAMPAAAGTMGNYTGYADSLVHSEQSQAASVCLAGPPMAFLQAESSAAVGVQDLSSGDGSLLHAAGDACCSLAVSSPGAVNTTEAVSHGLAMQQSYLQHAEAGAQTGPGPCAEGVEWNSQGLYGSTAAACGRSSPAAGYSNSRCSSAASTLSSCKASSFNSKMLQHGDPWLNPGVGLELMQNMGIAGSGSQPFARTASALLHAALLAPRALHNFPRGRWLVRCLFEAIFVAMYQVNYHDT
jgi:hypothetical protein